MRYAFCTLVMKGNGYIPGALVLASSLRKQLGDYSKEIDLICMVTNDVSKDGIEKLQKYYTHVKLVEYIICKEPPSFSTQKQNDKYAKWMDIALTKWACLQFIEYDKILMMDADIFAMPNPGKDKFGLIELFDLEAPAATFSTPWMRGYSENRGGIPNPFLTESGRPMYHGEKIHGGVGLASIRRGNVAPACSVVLLKPNKQDYLRLIHMAQASTMGYRCNSGADDQALTILYSNQTWTHIYQTFSYIPWHSKWLPSNENNGDLIPRALHFFSTKPWELERGTWPDMDIWYAEFDELNN